MDDHDDRRLGAAEPDRTTKRHEAPEPDLSLPSEVGPFRILSPLGTGGMGEVYLAEQRSPVRRRVALKVVKLGMDTREVLRRFDAERQALAVMDHPNIAKVYEAGATDSGRPYFAMEWIQGKRITDYCDDQRLGIDERLALMIQVCQAVQHAHQKGVIHRDLKPSNILVSTHDGVPMPKVIDFGIAKAVEHRLSEHTMFTAVGQLVGTPDYMSPEQAEASKLDVDTRTDVYSLGVILYELLTGTRPFDSSKIREASCAEIQRMIRETPIPRPSTRLSGLSSVRAEVAARRSIAPDALDSRIRGDLDWIVLKAIEKDRDRRYQTANALAADIGRHLRDEPVVASPPSRSYRTRKFIRRHRRSLAGAAIVSGALIFGLVGALYGLVTAQRERDRALVASQTTAAINGFLNEMLASANPEVAAGGEVTVREILDRAAGRIEPTTFAEQPLVEVELRTTISGTYELLGDYDLARTHLARALELATEHVAPDDKLIGELRIRSGKLAENEGDYAKAVSESEKGVAIHSIAYGADDDLTLAATSELALFYVLVGRNAEADSLSRRAIAGLEGRTDVPTARIARVQSARALILEKLGRLDESIEAHRQAVAGIKSSEGAEALETGVAVNNLAASLEAAGRYEESEVAHRESLGIYRKILPEGHDRIGASLGNLGLVLSRLQRPKEAEAMQREALAIKRVHLPDGHPNISATLNNLGLALADQSRFAEAEENLREAVDIAFRLFGDEHVMTAAMKGNLGNCLARAGKLREGERVLLESYRRLAELVGERHQRTLRVAGFLGDHYERMGNVAEGEVWRARSAP